MTMSSSYGLNAEWREISGYLIVMADLESRTVYMHHDKEGNGLAAESVMKELPARGDAPCVSASATT
jgi:hypothetical protein